MLHSEYDSVGLQTERCVDLVWRPVSCNDLTYQSVIPVIKDVSGAGKENYFVSVLVSDRDGDSVVTFYVPTLRSVSSGREVEIGTVEIIIDGREREVIPDNALIAF